MSLRTALITSGFLLATLGRLAAQSSSTPTAPFPQRGILPGSSQVASNYDEVNLNSGNLLYAVPLYRFPGGPGSLAMNIGLVYNSFIWDPMAIVPPCPIVAGQAVGCAQPYTVYGQSQTGGGWNYSFNYQLSLESAAGPTGCTAGIYRLTLIFPDGSRHILHPKLNSGQGIIPEFSADGFYGDGPGGLAGCTGSYSGRISYFSDDSTYIQVDTSASGSVTWTATLPDGTTAAYNPASCQESSPTQWSPGGPGTGAIYQANSIADRNGNSLTICATTVFLAPNSLPEPQFTITDQLGRLVQLSPALNPNGNGQLQDTLMAPGVKKRVNHCRGSSTGIPTLPPSLTKPIVPRGAAAQPPILRRS